MSGTYKREKEAFVSGMTGSSITHVNLVSLVALASVVLYSALRTRLPQTRQINFVLSWLLLVLPPLLSMTAFAERPVLLSLILLTPAVFLLLVPRQEGPSPLPSKQPTLAAPAESQRTRLPPLPALSTYRAHMMLMTILAILAVDFPVFPRALAKCETFGVSLMDLGVGSFVFSQGVVSAIPLVRDPSYLTAPLWKKLAKVVRKSLPIIFLGVVRVILVKGTEYPEHESEYGTHWNFFITLALLPILQVLLHPIIIFLPISLVGILAGIAQQVALTQFGLKDYVLNAPRTSLLSANKEGLVSLPGYLVIHLLGLSVGTLVLPPSPSFFRHQQHITAEQVSRTRSENHNGTNTEVKYNKDLDPYAPRQLGKTATELCSYAIVWWSLLGIARFFNIDGPWGSSGGVSRRMVNISYILWVVAYNTTFLLAYILVLDMMFFPGPKPKKQLKHLKSPSTPSPSPSSTSQYQYHQLSPKADGNPPELLDAINKQGLAVFLLANVMTGLINLSVNTMYASDTFAMVILGGYSFIISAIAWFWNRREKNRTINN